MMQWQPIETADKEKHLIVCGPSARDGVKVGVGMYRPDIRQEDVLVEVSGIRKTYESHAIDYGYWYGVAADDDQIFPEFWMLQPEPKTT